MTWGALTTDLSSGLISEINNNNFQTELRKSERDSEVKYIDNDSSNDFVVKFNKTGHEYIVDKTGRIRLSDEELIEDDTLKQMTELGLVDFWPLQGSLNNEILGRGALEHYQGANPVLMRDGVYLDKSTLSTHDNYAVGSEYSMVIQTKDLLPNSSNAYRINLLAGIGNEGTGIGGRILGIAADMDYFGLSGSGDQYSVTTNVYNDDLPEGWNTFIITWDGTDFKFYINNQLMGKKSRSQCPEDKKLYVGGCNGTWGYTIGQYRNLMIFDKALDEDTAKSFNSLIGDEYKNEPDSFEVYNFPRTDNQNTNYIVSEQNEFIATIGGRNFYKTNAGDAICVLVYSTNYLGPFLISTDKNAIKYTGGDVDTSIYYHGKRYYYTNGQYFMPKSSSYTTDREVFNTKEEPYTDRYELAFDILEAYYNGMD